MPRIRLNKLYLVYDSFRHDKRRPLLSTTRFSLRPLFLYDPYFSTTPISLRPLFLSRQANAEAIRNAGTGGRRHLHNVDIKANRKPLVEYTRGTSEDSASSPSPSQPSSSQPPPPGKKRAVAKKSTGGVRAADRSSPSSLAWEAPWVRAAQKRQSTAVSTPSTGPDVKEPKGGSKGVNEWMNEWMFNDTPAQKTDRLLGVRKR